MALCGSLALAAAGMSEVTFPDLTGRVLIDNERVLVTKYAVSPGRSTGHHAHSSPELLVYLKGGTLRSEQDGRSTLWRDGRVVWLNPSVEPGPGSRNVGASVIEFLEVMLKPPVAGRPSNSDFGYLSYPNVVGEDILDNDQVIVQRFAMKPGEWEGVHGHHPNTLYIFVKGAHWLSKTTNPPSEQRGNSPDGDVAWMAPVDISAGHQSGNVGSTTSDVIWIALKN